MENLNNSTNSQKEGELSEESRAMVIDSLRGIMERRKEDIKNGEKSGLPDQYYGLVQKQIDKYDAEHRNTDSDMPQNTI